MFNFNKRRDDKLRDRYIELLKRSICFTLWNEPDVKFVQKYEGHIWHKYAHSMIGVKRMENVQHCVEQIIKNKIDGDFIETGVWRGGTTIFMKGLLKAYNDNKRKVFAADSFEGLPAPNLSKYPADISSDLHTYQELAISIDEVRKNFQNFDLLDENVVFIKGWFKDTLPDAPINKLSLLRLDGDMYESTINVLDSLYHKLSIGGFCIIDDYNCIEACKLAVTDFRNNHGITEQVIEIDWTGAYWQKMK
jgi:hypothetical protein